MAKKKTDRRVQAAANALQYHALISGGEGPRADKGAALTDLLVNLTHYAEEHGLNIEDTLRIARYHFDAEKKS